MSDQLKFMGSQVKTRDEKTKTLIDALAQKMRLKQWCCEMVMLKKIYREPVEIKALIEFMYNFITNEENNNDKSA
jgi:hypothetical protein